MRLTISGMVVGIIACINLGCGPNPVQQTKEVYLSPPSWLLGKWTEVSDEGTFHVTITDTDVQYLGNLSIGVEVSVFGFRFELMNSHQQAKETKTDSEYIVDAFSADNPNPHPLLSFKLLEDQRLEAKIYSTWKTSASPFTHTLARE